MESANPTLDDIADTELYEKIKTVIFISPLLSISSFVNVYRISSQQNKNSIIIYPIIIPSQICVPFIVHLNTKYRFFSEVERNAVFMELEIWEKKLFEFIIIIILDVI
ncbi:MAG: hypothetical protein ACRCZO_02690 [Cetobacterium sp.]